MLRLRNLDLCRDKGDARDKVGSGNAHGCLEIYQNLTCWLIITHIEIIGVGARYPHVYTLTVSIDKTTNN